jgi:hypothetical protein
VSSTHDNISPGNDPGVTSSNTQPRPILYDDPANVERLREKIHEVWGWCAPDDNPDDPVCRGGLCERGAKSLHAALVAEAK